MNTPLVSVVIPTYNRAALLERAIRSVVGQGYEHFELLIVDDGSTEDIEAVVRAFDDERLQYLRNEENLGAGGSRNRGAREARGKYLAFLDADDEWLPGKLGRQVRLMRGASQEKLALVYGSLVEKDEKGNATTLEAEAQGCLTETLLRRGTVVHGLCVGALIDRAVFEELGGFDREAVPREDYDFTLRLSLRGYTVACDARPVTRVHAYGDDRLSTNHRMRVLGILRVYKKHRALFHRTEGARHFVDLVEAARHLAQMGHLRLSWLVYRYLVRHARPPAFTWRYVREYLAVPAIIAAQRSKALCGAASSSASQK